MDVSEGRWMAGGIYGARRGGACESSTTLIVGNINFGNQILGERSPALLSVTG